MWLGKKKSGIALAMVLVLVGLVAACSSGGDDVADYNFNGTWTFALTVVQSNVPSVPVGTAGIDVVRITQTGTGINAIIAGVPPMIGACDPVNGTFSATGASGVVIVTIAGVAVDDDTMDGELTMTNGPAIIRFQGTMQLATRDRAAAGPSGFVGKTLR
jgi:hypothetical protein